MKTPKVLTLREQKALENLKMILSALGKRGRANITSKSNLWSTTVSYTNDPSFPVATFLVAIGKHLSIQDSQVATWFDEYFQTWGVSYEELMNSQFGVVSTYSPPIRDGVDASQAVADFDYDIDVGVSGHSERSLSNSDASSTTQSLGPSALAAASRVANSSPSHISASGFFVHEESRLLHDFTNPSSSLGNLTNGGLLDIRMMEEAAGELGALAGAASVDALQNSGASGMSLSHAIESLGGNTTTNEHLSALVTHGLGGQAVVCLNNQEFYARMSKKSDAGVLGEGGGQSTTDPPSLARAFSGDQPQARRGHSHCLQSTSQHSQSNRSLDIGRDTLLTLLRHTRANPWTIQTLGG